MAETPPLPAALKPNLINQLVVITVTPIVDGVTYHEDVQTFVGILAVYYYDDDQVVLYFKDLDEPFSTTRKIHNLTIQTISQEN